MGISLIDGELVRVHRPNLDTDTTAPVAEVECIPENSHELDTALCIEHRKENPQPSRQIIPQEIKMP
jgi:hypothetical protein